jgi:hypothetical protein
MKLHQYRITKYNPAHRNAEGGYVEDAWTSASQIGRRFKGKTLTRAEYLSTEDDYVAVALALLDTSELSHLRATNIRRSAVEALSREFVTDREHDALPFLQVPHIEEDTPIQRAEMETIIRASLREQGGCNLEWHGRFFLHFGWDYYMYAGSVLGPDDVKRLLNETRLYIEIHLSPYASVSPNVRTCSLAAFDRGSNELVEEIPLGKLPVGEIRELLGYSPEHPVYGQFDITQTQCVRLAPHLRSKVDLDRFFFQLDTQD